MAEFAVTVTRIREVEPHPNADRLDLAVIGDYRCVVLKDQYTAGDLVAYIPEGALLPEPVLEVLNMKGSSLLAGKARNRVKAIRLRGQLSQGICYPVSPTWKEGEDVAEELGVTKYIPPIPTSMGGYVDSVGQENTVRFDVENYRRFPDILQEGEPVVMTEKLHGTLTGIGVLPEPAGDHGDVVVFSKKMGFDGLSFKMDPDINDKNLYVRVARTLGIRERVQRAFSTTLTLGSPVFLLGESFGVGVQDLHYGADTTADRTLGFRVFAIFVGNQADRSGRFLHDDELEDACHRLDLERVPVLYRGPFSKEVMLEHTVGREQVSGKEENIREGLVVTPAIERQDFNLPLNGRVILKSISAKYLLRKPKKGQELTDFD